MTGPEHYQAAEAALKNAASEVDEMETYLLNKAQVHATLALAAATAMNGFGTDDGPMTPQNYAAWDSAAGVSGSDRQE